MRGRCKASVLSEDLAVNGKKITIRAQISLCLLFIVTFTRKVVSQSYVMMNMMKQ